MKTLLIILLFSGSLHAAKLVAVNHPLYFLDNGPEILVCKAGAGIVKCLGRNKVTKIEVLYNCTAVKEADGYIKDCKVSGSI